MATMQDLIERAYRKLGIVAYDVDMTADQASEGLETLNSLLHEWKLRDVDISYSDLELTGTFPLTDEYKEGTVHILAGRLSPNYEVPANFDPDHFFRVIQAAYSTIDEVSLDKAVTEVPSKKERDGTLGYLWY